MWFDFRALDTLHEGLQWRRPSLKILRPPPSSHLGVCASPPPCRGGAAVGRARLEHQQHAAGARQRAKVGSLPCACAAVHAPLTAIRIPSAGSCSSAAFAALSDLWLLLLLLSSRYLPGVDGELITGVMVPWLYVGSCMSGEALLAG